MSFNKFTSMVAAIVGVLASLSVVGYFSRIYIRNARAAQMRRVAAVTIDSFIARAAYLAPESTTLDMAANYAKWCLRAFVVTGSKEDHQKMCDAVLEVARIASLTLQLNQATNLHAFTTSNT